MRRFVVTWMLVSAIAACAVAVGRDGNVGADARTDNRRIATPAVPDGAIDSGFGAAAEGPGDGGFAVVGGWRFCNEGEGTSCCAGVTPFSGGLVPCSACSPLATVVAKGDCPATWGAAVTDKAQVCADYPEWDADVLPLDTVTAFLSSGACGGWLRYTRGYGEGGPAYCYYEPVTGALAAFYASGGKDILERASCGLPITTFDDRVCPGSTCADTDVGVDAGDGG